MTCCIIFLFHNNFSKSKEQVIQHMCDSTMTAFTVRITIFSKGYSGQIN